MIKNIALVGCGTVGSTVAKLLLSDRQSLFDRSSIDICLKYIVDLDQQILIDKGLPSELFESDFQKVLDDPEVEIVIELVGGLGFARKVISSSFDAGKHVVSANKYLLADSGAELFAQARTRGLCLAFEASCGGGIPIIRALTDGLLANTIQAVYGIVNGTCNFIVTEMLAKELSFEQALLQAQKAGLAEAEPSLDIDGFDSAHKIVIMASLAFGKQIRLDAIPLAGIRNLQTCDLHFADELGYTVKLLAYAINNADAICLRVEPAFISKSHSLACVEGAFNAVSVYGHTVGRTIYLGRGAGGRATASAIISDIISIANGSYPAIFCSFRQWPDLTQTVDQLSAENMVRPYFLRFMVNDRVGIINNITEKLAQFAINIHSVKQNDQDRIDNGFPLPLVFTTDAVRESTMNEAITAILKIPGIVSDYSIFPILEEHPE